MYTALCGEDEDCNWQLSAGARARKGYGMGRARQRMCGVFGGETGGRGRTWEIGEAVATCGSVSVCATAPLGWGSATSSRGRMYILCTFTDDGAGRRRSDATRDPGAPDSTRHAEGARGAAQRSVQCLSSRAQGAAPRGWIARVERLFRTWRWTCTCTCTVCKGGPTLVRVQAANRHQAPSASWQQRALCAYFVLPEAE